MIHITRELTDDNWHVCVTCLKCHSAVGFHEILLLLSVFECLVFKEVSSYLLRLSFDKQQPVLLVLIKFTDNIERNWHFPAPVWNCMTHRRQRRGFFQYESSIGRTVHQVAWVLSSGSKHPQRDAHNFPPVAERKSTWSYTSTPACLYGVKHN
jgi:hypothetical protein